MAGTHQTTFRCLQLAAQSLVRLLCCRCAVFVLEACFAAPQFDTIFAVIMPRFSCGNTSLPGFIYAGLLNEAGQNIEGWPNRGKEHPAEKVATPLQHLLQTTTHQSGGLADLLRGTGPWRWGQVDSLYFHARGVANVASAVPAEDGWLGRWSVEGDGRVMLQLCGERFSLSFHNVWQALGRWRFDAVDAAGNALSDGRLDDVGQQVVQLLPELEVPPGALGQTNVSFVTEIAGSGPWEWAGQGPFAFLRGGQLHTPWGNGRWGVQRQTSEGVEQAKDGQVFADFVGSQHDVYWSERECLRMQSSRKADAEKVGIDFAGGAEPMGRKCQPKLTQKVAK